MVHSAPHPGLSVRPLLSEFDGFISDAQLEALYNVFESMQHAETQFAFGIIFPTFRAPYKDLCIGQSVQLERAQGDKERAEEANRVLVRQVEVYAMQLARAEEDKRDLVRQIEAQAEASKLTNEAHNHQVAQLEQQIITYRDERAVAIAQERQSTQIFQNHLLHSPRLKPPTLCGSVTRATTWQHAKVTHAYSKRPLPVRPELVASLQQHFQLPVEQLLVTPYAHETHMYTDFLAIFSAALTDKASYHDTSRNPYLNGLEPDLTLAVHGVTRPDPVNVLVLVEVKKRHSALGTDKVLGQILDYLVALMAEQEGRRFFTGVLSNVSENLVVTLEVTGTGCALVEHHISTIYETLAFLYDTALAQHSHRPPTLGFSLALGTMEKRLGNTRKSVVGQFTYRGEVVAVKRSEEAKSEIALLSSFKTMKNLPRSIPTLVYEAPDLTEFGITPVGIPLVPGTFAFPGQARVLIYDIHAALCWLHLQGIVHRDVRCDNVIIDSEGRGVLIDFDSACNYRRGSSRIWRGGYVSCPPRLVRDVHRHGWLKLYSPTAADDWHAFVLMVNCLVFPTTFVGFQSHLIGDPQTDEARRFIRLWDSLESSPVWGPFVNAAFRADEETLGKISGVFAWL